MYCEASTTSTEPSFEFEAVDEVRNGQSGLAIYFTIFNNLFELERKNAFLPNVSSGTFLYGMATLPSTINAIGDLFGDSDPFEIQMGSDQASLFVLKIRSLKQGSQTQFTLGKCGLLAF